MVGDSASVELQKRKAALEAKLEEKSLELKEICIAEAELTGILPIETPLEPSGSPPKFRRRIPTMFPFTEDAFGNFKPVNLQINSKGRCQISPKRGSHPALSQWLTGYDTLPANMNAGSSTSSVLPTPGTWSHSPTKSPSTRTHPYMPKARMKLFKKDW